MGSLSLTWGCIYVATHYAEISIKSCPYIPSSPNGGSISMMVFSRIGCHWKVMVDRLWFAIYNKIIELLMFKN